MNKSVEFYHGVAQARWVAYRGIMDVLHAVRAGRLGGEYEEGIRAEAALAFAAYARANKNVQEAEANG